MMHGLADLTAPYQHGVSLARALTEAGVLFRYQVCLNIQFKHLLCTNCYNTSKPITLQMVL